MRVVDDDSDKGDDGDERSDERRRQERREQQQEGDDINETEGTGKLRLRTRTLDWEALWLSCFIGYLLAALYTKPVNTQRKKKGVNGAVRLAYHARKGGKGGKRKCRETVDLHGLLRHRGRGGNEGMIT